MISQSMYFPWVGLLEQIRLADVFVHYDDVQYTRGFYNRVQVKTAQGSKWITVPLKDHHRGQLIDEVLLDDRLDWRGQHREILRASYQKAPFLNDLLTIVDAVFRRPAKTLADVSRASLLALADYFGIAQGRRFLESRNLNVGGSSSQRLLDIARLLGADIYITGHGARNYLDHSLFENAGVEVRYMKYECLAYPQFHGEFTPYVTGLDLVAHCGREGVRFIKSETIHWKEMPHGSD